MLVIGALALVVALIVAALSPHVGPLASSRLRRSGRQTRQSARKEHTAQFPQWKLVRFLSPSEFYSEIGRCCKSLMVGPFGKWLLSLARMGTCCNPVFDVKLITN